MKKFIVTVTPTSAYGRRLPRPSTFVIRAWAVENVERKAREQGMCLASDVLTIREANKNESGGYIE